MTVITSEVLLRQLEHDVREILQIAQGQFVPLRENQLHWQPAPEKWSIAQCLEHLNRFGRHYLPAMQTGIQTAVAKGIESNPEFSPGWLGGFLIKSVKPQGSTQAKGKYPSPKAYNPSRSGTVSPHVLPEFLQGQRDMLQILAASRQVDLNRVRIPVSVSRFIRLAW